MKKFVMLLAVFVFLFSCQKEELTVIDNQDETSFIEDTELVRLIMSVASHDGSFDNKVDKADCFSINFPYTIYLNGESHSVNSINDLLIIEEHDEVLPIFPIDITFANYIEATITTNEAFNELISKCDDGTLYNDKNTCQDFLYPIYVAVFNPDSNDFETISFDHDKDTFTTIVDFTSNTLAAIQYPIQIELIEGAVITVNNNANLKVLLSEQSTTCE